MKKYKIKLQRTQRGKMLDWAEERVVECSRPPQIGEGRALLIEPPIFETIIEVEEIITEDQIIKWFAENYIEDESICKYRLEQAEIESAATIEDLYLACKKLTIIFSKKTSIAIPLRYLKKLANNGIAGSIAGERLRDYYETVYLLK